MSTDKKRREMTQDEKNVTIAGFASAVGGWAASPHVQRHFSGNLDRATKAEKGSHYIKPSTITSMAREHGLHTSAKGSTKPFVYQRKAHMPDMFSQHAEIRKGGSAFKANYINNGSRDRAALLHEMGHAIGHGRGTTRLARTLKGGYGPSQKMTRGLMENPGAFLGSNMLVSGIGRERGTKTDTAMRVAGHAINSHAAPMLIEEARATFHALNHIRKKQGFGDAKRAGKLLGHAYGTYASAALPGVASSVSGEIGRAYLNRKDKAKMTKQAGISNRYLEKIAEQVGRNASTVVGTATAAGLGAHSGIRIANKLAKPLGERILRASDRATDHGVSKMHEYAGRAAYVSKMAKSGKFPGQEEFLIDKVNQLKDKARSAGNTARSRVGKMGSMLETLSKRTKRVGGISGGMIGAAGGYAAMQHFNKSKD